VARILVLDDDIPTRQFLRDILEKLLKHTVSEAGRVSAAVELAKGGTFDLMLLDLRLPDGTALDLCKALDGLKIAGDVPKWVVTGEKPLDWDAALWAGFGVRGCLVKPFPIDTLVSIVNECLGKSKT